MSSDWRAMHREWNAVFEKCRALAPSDTPAVESRARANINRYFAYLAYENGEFGDARRLVSEIARSDPKSFLTDPRTWKITAACLARAILPQATHRALQRAAEVHRD